MKNNFMAIDPGLQGTGVAIWKGDAMVPMFTAVLRSHGATDWIDRTDSLALQVRALAKDHNIGQIICEFMEMHQSARAQMMWKTGDFQRTLFLIGTFHGVTRHRSTFTVVPPSEWKGQLPKSVVITRIKKLFGELPCRQLKIETHAWDAVGIGLWHRGVLK
jgi:Holliday junction resolvasome RuvABC endonuclease subunit